MTLIITLPPPYCETFVLKCHVCFSSTIAFCVWPSIFRLSVHMTLFLLSRGSFRWNVANLSCADIFCYIEERLSLGDSWNETLLFHPFLTVFPWVCDGNVQASIQQSGIIGQSLQMEMCCMTSDTPRPAWVETQQKHLIIAVLLPLFHYYIFYLSVVCLWRFGRCLWMVLVLVAGHV